jgi:DNA-binding response OmpR family regulator
MKERPTMKTQKNILVCEDDPVQLRILTALIDQAGYRSLAARSSREARTAASRFNVDAVLSDVQLLDGNAFDLVGDLRALGTDAPVIMTSAFSTDGMKARARRAGVKHFFDKPLNLQQIRAQVDEIFKAPPKIGAGVMIVEGHPGVRADLEHAAVEAGFDVRSTGDAAGAIELLKTRKPAVELLLVDLHAGGSEGVALIRKALEVNPSLYVVMMSGDATREEIRAGYAAGAASLILKSMPAGRLQTFLKASLKAARILQGRADALRERRERHAAQPVLDKIVRWFKSCLYAPAHSRRGRTLGLLMIIGVSLIIGAGMASVLQTAHETADRYEAALDRAMLMMTPLQGPGNSIHEALPVDVRGAGQANLLREPTDAARGSHEGLLQDLQRQGRSRSPAEWVR